jgi:hypothetical protein
MPKRDLTNKRFGRLIARSHKVEQVQSTKRVYTYEIWLCDCDCGNKTTTRTGRLLRGGTRSCGCLVTEALEQANCKRSAAALLGLHPESFNHNAK